MPSFNDPHADAREMAGAVGGLAHATRRIADPEGLSALLGELRATAGSLSRVLDQVADAYRCHAARAAAGAGDQIAGARWVSEATAGLEEAARRIGDIDTLQDWACVLGGRIVWEPADAGHRWVNVVFFQGDEADRVLEIIDRRGTEAAIRDLVRWDDGEETVEAARENGDVYDSPPRSRADRLAVHGDYALTYSSGLRYVGLSRRVRAPRGDDALPPRQTGASEPVGPCSRRERWAGSSGFLPDAVRQVVEQRGLAR